MNFLSWLSRKSINIIYAANPLGTSLGVLIGFIIDAIIKITEKKILESYSLDLSVIETYHSIALGVVIMNLKYFFYDNKINPAIKSKIDTISAMQNSGLITKEDADFSYKTIMRNEIADHYSLNNNHENNKDNKEEEEPS